MTWRNGGTYKGLVGKFDIPSVFGTLYFPRSVGGGIQYQGQFFRGKKHGNGVLYHKNGSIVYQGEFSNGMPLNHNTSTFE